MGEVMIAVEEGEKPAKAAAEYVKNTKTKWLNGQKAPIKLKGIKSTWLMWRGTVKSQVRM